jgi:competence protein ComEC
MKKTPALLFLLLLLLFPLSLFAQQLQVHFIDVGQGDAVFITNSTNQAILIDAGDKSAARTVINYLREHNVKKLDILIASHPDSDHIGGMTEVVEDFPVILYLDSGVEKPTQTSGTLNLLIKEKGIKHRIARAGQNYDLDDGASLRILFPSEPLIIKPKQGTESNANSIVVKLTYKNVSFLLPGDVEEATEERLLREQGAGVLSSTILKVAHLGSKYATTQAFLDAVNFNIAVISVGEGNSYGHPANETLKRLKDKGVAVYRTDYNGNIIIKTDGNTLEIVVQKQEETENIHARAPPLPSPGKAVYITRTGSKYHQVGCRYLKKSCIPIGLKEAKERGYSPCSVCRPPD